MEFSIQYLIFYLDGPSLEAAGQGGLGIAGAAGVAKPTGPSRTTDRSVDVLTSCHCLEIHI